MDRINRIREHARYQEYYKKIEACEQDRIFCRHNMAHFLDVARLAWIINLSEHMDLAKERVYGAALLHDIGRHIQYEDGTPHQIASHALAGEILTDCGFDEEEKEDILLAIINHRNKEIEQERSLSGVIYRADKMSRSCFACQAEHLCDWKKDKKNLFIKW